MGLTVLVPALADGTVGSVVGAMTGWFLYQSRWNEFHQQRLAVARNRELMASNAEQHVRNAELAELMGIAAHDLRTPLLGVRNLLDLTRQQTGLEREKVDAVLAEASRTCGDMVGRVGRLLEAHEAEHPGERTALRVLDLRAVFNVAAARAQRLGETRAIEVRLTVPEQPAHARVRSEALEAALDNLLGNALKFSPAGCVIDVVLFGADGKWWGEVRDEGPGVPMGERSQLFRKFNRGSTQSTQGEVGTGLGLFIVKTQIEAMGGRVGFTAREPCGAVFRVELPQA